GLTAIVVSFCGALHPVWEPTGTTVSPTIWSTLGAGSGYGLGWPRKSWQSADSAGESTSSSCSSPSTCLSSGLWWAAAAAAGPVPVVSAASDAISPVVPASASRRVRDLFIPAPPRRENGPQPSPRPAPWKEPARRIAPPGETGPPGTATGPTTF